LIGEKYQPLKHWDEVRGFRPAHPPVTKKIPTKYNVSL